jgi:glycosyltransferase involved in cell wall biosynthesis
MNNLKKIKIIHIAHVSHSYFANEKDDLKKIILNDWYSKTAFQLKKFYPNLEVECWAPEKLERKKTEFYEKGIMFRFFPTTFSPVYALDFSIPLIKELKHEIKKNKKQGVETIIHLHEYHNLHGLIISLLFKKQKIIAQHHGGSWPLKHLKEKEKYKKIFLLFVLGQLLEKIALKNIDCFFALSAEEMEYLKKEAKNSKIQFQTMGIDDEYFNKIKKDYARKKIGIKKGEKMLLFIGRVSKIKGLDYLIRAMKFLPETNLYILGYGEEREELEKLSEELRLKNIHFMGGVFGEEKMLFLSAADSLILPSLKEGAPVTLMEAVAKNLPIIVSNIGGVKMMIEEGREGIIIKPRSSKEIVLAVKKMAGWKKKDIQKYAEKYRWKEIIEKTVKEYYS